MRRYFTGSIMLALIIGCGSMVSLQDAREAYRVDTLFRARFKKLADFTITKAPGKICISVCTANEAERTEIREWVKSTQSSSEIILEFKDIPKRN